MLVYQRVWHWKWTINGSEWFWPWDADPNWAILSLSAPWKHRAVCSCRKWSSARDSSALLASLGIEIWLWCLWFKHPVPISLQNFLHFLGSSPNGWTMFSCPFVQPSFIKHQHSCLGDLCICFSPFWPKNSQLFRSMSHHISSVQNRIPFHPSWSRMGFPVHGLW